MTNIWPQVAMVAATSLPLDVAGALFPEATAPQEVSCHSPSTAARSPLHETALKRYEILVETMA